MLDIGQAIWLTPIMFTFIKTKITAFIEDQLRKEAEEMGPLLQTVDAFTYLDEDDRA